MKGCNKSKLSCIKIQLREFFEFSLSCEQIKKFISNQSDNKQI